MAGAIRSIFETITKSTMVLATLFSMIGMTAASVFLWFCPDTFNSTNWLAALTTCAGLIASVVLKRTVDNSKLAKPGVGDGGN